jgi:hypothetical protein
MFMELFPKFRNPRFKQDLLYFVPGRGGGIRFALNEEIKKCR